MTVTRCPCAFDRWEMVLTVSVVQSMHKLLGHIELACIKDSQEYLYNWRRGINLSTGHFNTGWAVIHQYIVYLELVQDPCRISNINSTLLLRLMETMQKQLAGILLGFAPGKQGHLWKWLRGIHLSTRHFPLLIELPFISKCIGNDTEQRHLRPWFLGDGREGESGTKHAQTRGTYLASLY